jgi:hypothetical protein
VATLSVETKALFGLGIHKQIFENTTSFNIYLKHIQSSLSIKKIAFQVTCAIEFVGRPNDWGNFLWTNPILVASKLVEPSDLDRIGDAHRIKIWTAFVPYLNGVKIVFIAYPFFTI